MRTLGGQPYVLDVVRYLFAPGGVPGDLLI